MTWVTIRSPTDAPLGEIAHEGVTEVMVDAAVREGLLREMRAHRLGLAETLTDELLALAEDPDAGVRVAAVKGLARHGEAAIPALMQRAHDVEVGVRVAVAATLTALKFLPGMERAAQDSEVAVRRAVTVGLNRECMGRHHHAVPMSSFVRPRPPLPDDMLPLLIRLADDPDRLVRNGAIRVVGDAFPTFEAIEPVIRTVGFSRGGDGETVLQPLLGRLAHRFGEPGRRLLVELISKTDSYIEYCTRTTELWPFFTNQAHRGTTRVRRDIARCIHRMGPEGAPILQQLLRDEDDEVRNLAAAQVTSWPFEGGPFSGVTDS